MAAYGRSEAVCQKMADVARTHGTIFDLYFHRRRVLSNHQLASGHASQAIGINPVFPASRIAGGRHR